MRSTAVARVHDAPVAMIGREADTLPDVFRLAEMLVPTGMLPDTIRTAGQCVAIILAGRELAMPPMRALRSLVLVKGKVVESADSQLSRFKTDGGRAQFKTLDETKAVLWLKHPNGDEHTESFTIEDAKKAGLAGKGTWQQFPKAMLRSRVITSALKSIGWEGGAGAYDPEEAAAFAPQVTDDVAAPVRDGVAIGARRDAGRAETMALEEAKAFLMPMGRFEGHPLSRIETHVLRAALLWTADHDSHPDFQLALATVLDARAVLARPSEAEGETAPASGAPQDSPAGNSGSPESPAPTAAPTAEPEDPYPDSTEGMTPGQLKSKALELLKHPAIAGNDKYVNGTKLQLESGLSVHQLRATVRTIEAMIASAPAKGKKGEKGAYSIGDLPGGV